MVSNSISSFNFIQPPKFNFEEVIEELTEGENGFVIIPKLFHFQDIEVAKETVLKHIGNPQVNA